MSDEKNKASNAPAPIKPLSGRGTTFHARRTTAKKPNWKEWAHIPEVRVWQACVLSLDIDPHSLKHHRDGWMAGPGSGPFFEDDTFSSASVEEEYKLRTRVLLANLSNRTFFSPGILSMESPAKCGVRLSDFAAWAVSEMKWDDLPPELVVLAQKSHTQADAPAPTVDAVPVTSQSGDDGTAAREGVQMSNERLTVKLGEREALPVRAIPYITGWKITPDDLAKQMARTVGAPFERLQNTCAYHLQSGQIVQVLPKEWDEIVVRLAAFEAELRAKFPNDDQGYAAWRKDAASMLPKGVFVWLDEFEKDFHIDFSPDRITFYIERNGDRNLIFTPMQTGEIRDMVLAGFDGLRPLSDKSTAALKLIADLDDHDARNKQRAERRRKEGRYNLEEAAKIIAQAAGAGYEAILVALMESVESGTLSTYMPDNTAPIKYGSGQGKWPWADAYLDECYWDDLNEWLETKMKRVDYEFPNPADTSAAKVEAVVKGITKQQVITAFEGLHFNADQWGKYLASPPEWLIDCRVAKGSKKTSATWNPVLIAIALADPKRGISVKKLDALFVGLKDWTDEWREKSDYLP